MKAASRNVRCEILQELELDDPKLELPWTNPLHANLGLS